MNKEMSMKLSWVRFFFPKMEQGYPDRKKAGAGWVYFKQ